MYRFTMELVISARMEFSSSRREEQGVSIVGWEFMCFKKKRYLAAVSSSGFELVEDSMYEEIRGRSDKDQRYIISFDR